MADPWSEGRKETITNMRETLSVLDKAVESAIEVLMLSLF